MATKREPSPLDSLPSHGDDPHSLPPRPRQLWQGPLLLLSVALFAYAAWLFIDPKPGPTDEQKVEAAAAMMAAKHPQAARELLSSLVSRPKLAPATAARVHLLLSEAIETEQQIAKSDIPANHALIADNAKSALALGIKPTAPICHRIGASYEALGRDKDAIEYYKRAIALEPDTSQALRRKVIDLQLDRGDLPAVEASLDEYLKDDKLPKTELAWALGEKSRLVTDRGDFAAARALLAKALTIDPDKTSQGLVNYRLGYCAHKLGDDADAERYLRVSRDLLTTRHATDADAAALLGQILQARGETAEAASFYQDVLVSHPDSTAAPLARLGRGVCRIETGGSDDAGLTDLHDVVKEINTKPSRARMKPDALAALRRGSGVLTVRGNFQGAMELLSLEQTLSPEPQPDFFARLGAVYEKRADQLQQSVAAAPSPDDKARRARQSKELLIKAGDASIAYSKGLTLQDNGGHGEALWKGIDLYDRAGDMHRVTSALEVFVAENPGDGLAPEALWRLGRAYQAVGLFDKAIAAFQKNQFRYPQSLFASKSGVPLAQSYIAEGPERYPKAESALVATLGSPLITPDADEFREALFELAQLQYRTDRYEEAVSRLSELIERYPKEDRKGQILFLMADSYRKSAALLKQTKEAWPATAPSTPLDAANLATRTEAAAAKRDRLERARRLYDDVIEHYRVLPPTRDADKLYQKLAHFYRADCLFDTQNYEEAIRLYDAAALRYQDDASALAAYVQVVNCYRALGRPEEAKTANARAKWLLRRMPAETFANGKFSMPKAFWDDWLNWNNTAGLW